MDIYMKVLRRGSTGPQVQLLQLALSRAGYLSAAGIDGVFGGVTYAALRRFQAENGLVADAVAGPLTWAALTKWLTGFDMKRIAPGDTLYGIAARYGTSVRALQTANPGLNPLNLQIGANIVIPLDFRVVPSNVSVTSTMVDFCIRGLKARYPFLTVGRIGSSVLGKPLNNIDIGNGANQVFYNAAHHADEWITTTLLLTFLENYAEAYAAGGRIFEYSASELYNGTKLSIVPLVNPDGDGFFAHKNKPSPALSYLYICKN
jgi:g-D-glutamyl-meso-diaminopimelate peptidase